jgi:tripartite-type tricarboxylate transporter receptor subunit TctC
VISCKLVQRKAHIAAAAIAALALVATGVPAKAQPYPSRSVTILVGYSAGGQADALARIIGKQLGETFKISVVIENKTGANGMIAAQTAARAEPDGYTILLVTDAMLTIDPHLASSNHFDLSKAMEPVVNVAWSPLLLAAANNVPANSVAELVALGKQKSQNLSFGSSGSSTPHRLAGEMLQKSGGFTMTHIQGTAASVNDLLAEQIPLVFGAPTAVEPLATAGKIKLLGVTSEKRYPLLPIASQRPHHQRNLPRVQDHQLHRLHAAEENAGACDRGSQQGSEYDTCDRHDARMVGQAGHGRRGRNSG